METRLDKILAEISLSHQLQFKHNTLYQSVPRIFLHLFQGMEIGERLNVRTRGIVEYEIVGMGLWLRGKNPSTPWSLPGSIMETAEHQVLLLDLEGRNGPQMDQVPLNEAETSSAGSRRKTLHLRHNWSASTRLILVTFGLPIRKVVGVGSLSEIVLDQMNRSIT